MLRFSARGHYAEAIDATRLLCVDGARPRDRRTTQDTKKFPPLHVNPQRAIVSGQLSALIGLASSCLLQSPDVRCGSFSTEMACPRHVCFPPDSDHSADIWGGPFRAKLGRNGS